MPIDIRERPATHPMGLRSIASRLKGFPVRVRRLDPLVAVQEAKIGPTNDISHITAQIIIRCVTNFQLRRLS
ncbi:hypothetical protein [Mycobacterium riyadhense]|uniref:hypothetical protein n=1 Tax=Mycobacterium riyadhense TaxID=486698 RepID=UPI00111C44F2|nr:hypothetical protein [Mycobacterium riyadhense]MCV7145912.1 hypothetical protein [Mycobacterium riyadhense]